MATLNKMTGFKVYKGTKDTFISTNKAEQYKDAIVFITGGTGNEKNSCIFAQGTYFANISELIKAINYVKGITVSGIPYNAAVGGGYVAFEASDPSTVAVNANSNGIAIGLTEAFINKVNNTATLAGNTSTALGTKDDAAAADGSAFARIAALANAIGSGGSVSGQITNAINSLRTEIVGTLDDTDDAKTLAAINDELNGLQAILAGVKVNGKNIVNNGVAQEVVLTGGDIKVGGTSAIKDSTVESVIVNHEGRVKANEEAIASLNGTGDGSINQKIQNAIDAFATNVSNDNVINTLKELVDYVAGVPGGDKLATALNDIATNKAAIAALQGDAAGSIAKQIQDAIDAEVLRANAAYDAAGAAAGVQTYADQTFEKIGVAANLIKGLNATIDGTGTNGIKVTVTETEGKITAVAVDDAAVMTAETNAKSYADSLFAWEEI